MTGPARRRPRDSRLLRRVQWAGMLTAVMALVALILPGPAHAAGSGYDQITGVGTTASAVTVTWLQGILDDTNTPIASANADRTDTTQTASDPLGFMHPDFQGLQVTVSQTANITHQGITVTWTGGKQSNVGGYTDDFLQMMECYGDASTGPTPEQCEYGSPGLLDVPSAANGLGTRYGDLCNPGTLPSVTNPPRGATSGGASAIAGCDTEEPSDPTHIAPSTSSEYDSTDSTFDIPFAPVTDPTDLDYAFGDTTYYSRFNTNEVQEAITSADGDGQQQFETLTGTQAPGLGCGDADSGQPRGCWLVIVPRGTYEPNGYQVNGANSALETSPLSASNWAQRIQIHLDYAPVGQFCPIGTPAIDMDGTQVVTRAVESWELALNKTANCSMEYSFIATTEASSTSDITSGATGLAFTTIPIGSEATRTGGSPPTDLPPILYAPVAISALDFGFNINQGNGYDMTPVKLTPLLLAKALTQTYRGDLPDYEPAVGDAGPSWAATYPTSIAQDPEFLALNPGLSDPNIPIAPLLTEDHSALNEQVWQWIQGDSTASGWLDGTPDASDGNMAIDPAYTSLDLGPAVDASSPRAYTGVCGCGGPPIPDSNPPANYTKDTLDLLPYSLNLDSATAAVLAANNPAESTWSTGTISPSGSSGWWQTAGIEPVGNIFMWAASDTSDLAAYGLTAAQLCNESGSTCIGPSTASLTAAVDNAQADSAGLLQVNPASPGTDAYPLVDVIYAAVATNQSAANLNNYAALIKYAVGDGQTAGTNPGNLPPGYLPLPSNLQTQAMNVVARLQADANPSASPSPSVSSSGSSASAAASSSAAGSQSGSQSESQSVTGSSTAPATTSTGNVSGSSSNGSSPQASSTSSASGSGSSGTTGGTTPGSTAGAKPEPTGSLRVSPGSSATSPGAVVSLPPSEIISAGKTGPLVLGNLRWALFAVVILGTLCAGGALMLRSGPLPTWLRRLGLGAWRA